MAIGGESGGECATHRVVTDGISAVVNVIFRWVAAIAADQSDKVILRVDEKLLS